MTTFFERFSQIRAQMTDAESEYGRQPGSVLLLAVSKTKPAADLAAAYHAGQRHFGESYLKEALAKQRALAHYDISWHFIGPIQSNKTQAIANHFAWVHSVDRLKIAKRLNQQRSGDLPPLNICLQINISGELSKSGVGLADLPTLVAEIKPLPRLKLRGVMAIPAKNRDFEQQRLPYREIYQAIARLENPTLDTFSFGMTGDLRAAIAEGSTIVRVGTALFGERKK